jgi:hypothetical protein
MPRIPHSLDNRLTDGGKTVSLTRRSRTLSPEIFRYSILLESKQSSEPWWDKSVPLALTELDSVHVLTSQASTREVSPPNVVCISHSVMHASCPYHLVLLSLIARVLST